MKNHSRHLDVQLEMPPEDLVTTKTFVSIDEEKPKI